MLSIRQADYKQIRDSRRALWVFLLNDSVYTDSARETYLIKSNSQLVQDINIVYLSHIWVKRASKRDFIEYTIYIYLR